MCRPIISRLTFACLLMLPSLTLAQQTWPAPDSGYPAAATNDYVAPQSANQQPFAQPPFATPPALPATSPRLAVPAQQTTAAEQVTALSVQAAEPTPEKVAKDQDEASPDGIADDLAAGAENAKNTFVKAVFENDRNAQIDLATKYLLPIVTIVFVMVLATWLGNYLRESVSGFVSRRVDVTLGRFTGTLVKFTVLTVALMSVLAYYGAEMTSLAALIAALGFAIGMALQGTLGNFASGIALLVFRPFNVGDYIVVNESEGTVQAIELFTTAIDTLDNRRVVLPNESVFGHRIENWTHNKSRRVDVLVGVSYSADMKQTRRVLTDAVASVPGAMLTPSPEVYLCELNASSVDWSCRVWCRPEEYLAVKERVTEAAKEALDRNGISIPFPQLDLHVVTPAIQQRKAAA